jgi:hypothetical protein
MKNKRKNAVIVLVQSFSLNGLDRRKLFSEFLCYLSKGRKKKCENVKK